MLDNMKLPKIVEKGRRLSTMESVRGRVETAVQSEKDAGRNQGERRESRLIGAFLAERSRERVKNKEKLSSSSLESEIPAEISESGSVPESVQKSPKGRSKFKAISKFKTVAKMVKTNIAWTQDFIETAPTENETTAYKVKDTDGKMRTLTFDVNTFKTRSFGGLSKKAKAILQKSPGERTESDIVILRDVIARLKCFGKYSKRVKEELARIISFEAYNDGRVLIKQGHIGMSFYFIISGAVVVLTTHTDKNTGQKHTQIIGELVEGSSFGELALVHNIKRTATIIVKGDRSEFLRVDRPDFDEILAATQRYEWERRLKIIQNLSLFKKWTPEEHESCSHKSRIVEYSPNKIIFGNTAEEQDNVYIIVVGECRVVRDITVLKRYGYSGATSLSLPKKTQKRGNSQPTREPAQRHVSSRRHNSKASFPQKERHIWSLYTLKNGKCFGLGENMTDTYIISKSRVECLLVPRSEFSKHGRGRMLERLLKEIQAFIPNNQKILEIVRTENKWREYKQQVISDVVSRRNIPNRATVEDIPRSIRSEAMFSLGNIRKRN